MCTTTELNAEIPQEIALKRQAREELTEHEALQLRRMHVARNRWRLALTLIRNPSLKRYRKQRLFQETEEAAADVAKDAVDVAEGGLAQDAFHVQNPVLTQYSEGDNHTILV